ncbi:MAG: FG-GAP-like repeat-containing protein, partial [Verrucomicrobiales bacterium]|nr:FG-GAP-like repeat-containing protein [Verrucomicrobiales bacterium]
MKSPNEIPEGLFGFAASGDDVNGDGRGDVIVGAKGERVVYVINGATGEVIHTVITSFAEIVSAVPDLNGDGQSDIASSDPGKGAVDIHSGATGEWLNTLTSPTEETGIPGARFGFSVSGIPDVNGDGRGDVIVGAVFEDLPKTPERPRAVADAGRAYIFDGATGVLLHALTSPNARADGQFGRSVTGIPDLNGDGRGDVAVVQVNVGGSPGNGRVYTFDGATGKLLRVMQAAGRAPNGFDYTTAVPDVNRDGWRDILVYAWNAGDPKAHLLDGESGE